MFLMGLQHRPAAPFRRGCELVRNGRVGKVTAIEVGLPVGPGGGKKEEMPVPGNLNYDIWLGSTPQVCYTEDRVHPQANIDARPGWLRCEQFGAGMITGWGAHFLDIMRWGMGWEATGPVAISGKGVFHAGGLWDVHGDYDVNATGAWVDFANCSLGLETHLMGGAKGSHLVIDNPSLYNALGDRMVYTMSTRTAASAAPSGSWTK